MKTRLAPLVTAFNALDLAFRVAGVIGGIAAVATHLPLSARRAEIGDATITTRMDGVAVRAEHRAHAGHGIRIIRLDGPLVPAPPIALPASLEAATE